jgi:4-hydroxybutyrate CoA-transferase
VHHVVTEYGIANLKGKSIRNRIEELVSIAHPDFRSELRSEARRLYKV